LITDEKIIVLKPKGFKLRIIGGVVLAILFPYTIMLAWWPFHLAYETRLYYSRFIFWVEILLLIVYSRKVERRPLLIWKDREFDILFFIGSVILLYILTWVASIIAFIPHMLGMHDNRVLIDKMTRVFKNHHGIMVFSAFTAGVTEELIFRGYIYTRLSLLFKKDYWAIILSALVFSAVHLPYKSLQENIYTFLIGVICAVYYQKYRDIKVIITLHFFIDFISFTLLNHYAK